MRKIRKFLLRALLVAFIAGGTSACSSLGGYWGLHGSTELTSDGHGGYGPPPPRPPKHKKPKHPKKKKHKKHHHHHDDYWD